MMKGLFSMYTAKEKNKSFYEHNFKFSKNKDTEIKFIVSESINDKITKGFRKTISDLSHIITDSKG